MIWKHYPSKYICRSADFQVLGDITGVRGENPAHPNSTDFWWRQENEQDNPLIWLCRDQNIGITQWLIYLFLPPASLPVLLLVWSVAVVWPFLTADSWSSALLLVCTCWEFCRVKHQRFRGKNISIANLLFYFHKHALFWSICACFWPRALIGFNQQTWQESCTWVRAHHNPPRGNITAWGQLIEIWGNIPSCSCLLWKRLHFPGRFRQP